MNTGFFAFDNADWFPVAGGLVVAPMRGYQLDRGAAGVLNLFAAYRRGSTDIALFWVGNGMLHTHDLTRGVAGAYHDAKPAASVTRGRFEPAADAYARLPR